MSERLFVYGTLRPEHAPHGVRPLLSGLRWLGAGSVRGRLFDLGDWPGAVVDAAAETRIHGRLAELPADPGLLEALDRYEGVRPAPEVGLFRRVRCRVERPRGGPLEAWIYEYARDPGDAPLCPAGRAR